ncbi:MAG TPA: YigZ family protein [Acholeplasmataceae bacterium]|nr:YigZ family protein [Acholeplasmataceae bacterium]
MFTITKEYTYTQEIKKSTFITYLAPVNSSSEANLYLENLRKKYPDATHHCYSYIIGESNNEYKYSDDGEPSQTAGIVIYDVLRKNDLTNIICVVIRYFGGIKLGAGGLVRAYSSSAGGAVSIAEFSKIIHYKHIKITFDYAYVNQIQKLLNDYENVEKTFLDKIIFSYKLPDSEVDDIKTQLIDITSNNIKIEVY